MQVLLDSIIYGLQRFGGISQYWSEVSTRLASHLNGDLRQRLPSQVLSEQPGTQLQTTQEIDLLPPKLARYLPIAAGTSSQGVVHSSYYRVPIRPSQLLVTTAYDFTYERYRDGLPRRVHSQQKRWALQRSNGILCISRATRDDALRLFPELGQHRMEVVHLASNPSVFYAGNSPRELLPAPLSQCNYALFVGQRSGYKRFDLAVGAVARVKGLTLAIVGPPLTPAEQQLLDVELPGKWFAATNASNELLRSLYVNALAFLYPSDYEGFGLPILDAMACGCPVICAERSSFPEVAGDAAILISEQRVELYANALRECSSPTSCMDLSRRGRVRAADFSWERTAEQTLAFYRDVLQSAGRLA